ncbi:MAG: helix-turn-helix domain-containing protein [Myxococcota bacterium]
MLAFPDVQILDVTGPLEVFAMASRLLAQAGHRDPGYALEVVAREAGPLRTSGGVMLVAERRLGQVRGPLDTLIVAGGLGVREVLQQPDTLAWVRRSPRRVRRLASVCSGAFVLAEAGLLDGRRATTHWEVCEALARAYPQVRVDADRIFVRDGAVATSAGVTAGMDLALALVEEDLGTELARAVARQLVLFLKRPGGQSQFSAQLESRWSERPSLAELQHWIHDHPEAELGVEALAARMAMSPRNFARVFARELGVTPARYVERARVEAARRRLEESEASVEEVADACGFGSAETLRRAFQRQLGVSPSAYRESFARCTWETTEVPAWP